MMTAPLFAFIGMPGTTELLIIGGIILLLFGNRLPSVMRSLGRGVIEFKKGVSGVEDDIETSVTAKKEDAEPVSTADSPKE